MSLVDVYLRGGAVIRLDVESFSVTSDKVTNALTGLTWEAKGGKRDDQPLYFRVDEIVAVVDRGQA